MEKMEIHQTFHSGIITSNKSDESGFYLMVIKVPVSFPEAFPGQFLMVRASDREIPFLARPFSIYSVCRKAEATMIEILYRTVGRGTVILSQLHPGDRVTILGPLGRGFQIMNDIEDILLIAGGIGVAPITFLAEHYRYRSKKTNNQNIVCYLGAQTARLLAGVKRLYKNCDSIRISTDDGTEGYCGLVTDFLKSDLPKFVAAKCAIYACGPPAMLKKVAEISKKYVIPCQVSVEEKMACGIGACLGCVMEAKGQKEKKYLRVCKEGPVFDASELEWK